MPEMLTDDQVKTNVAANLNRVLDERQITQKELAARTGDPPMTISNICNAKHVLGGGVLARICEALDIDMDRLVGPAPEFYPRTS
jgi:transcriptional regulator with XRE-family HTH domain